MKGKFKMTNYFEIEGENKNKIEIQHTHYLFFSGDFAVFLAILDVVVNFDFKVIDLNIVFNVCLILGYYDRIALENYFGIKKEKL